MLIIISDPHSFAMCCSETLLVMRIYNGSIGVVLQFALYVCVL